MTYTLTIPIDAPTLTAACHKAWDIVGKQCGLPFTVKAEPPQPPAQAGRTWTPEELRDIEDGIVPASRRYDEEFVAAVKAKAEGKAQ